MKNSQKTQKKSLLYRFVRRILLIFYKKREIVGIENLPNEQCIIVSNHAQMHGPLSSELFFPTQKKIWCVAQMMNLKEVPAYSYQDFWSKKPKYTRFFYKILSYILAPVFCWAFKNSDTIPVYKDSRIITTYKQTIKHLEDEKNIVIFPECYDKYNNIINNFQDKFIDVARFYYKKYNKKICFVPMYNAVQLKKLVFGKPITFNPDSPIEEQRKIICEYLQLEITKLAQELPVHLVVPYENVSKKHYKLSKAE